MWFISLQDKSTFNIQLLFLSPLGYVFGHEWSYWGQTTDTRVHVWSTQVRTPVDVN